MKFPGFDVVVEVNPINIPSVIIMSVFVASSPLHFVKQVQRRVLLSSNWLETSTSLPLAVVETRFTEVREVSFASIERDPRMTMLAYYTLL
jgi:hypothetical protein